MNRKNISYRISALKTLAVALPAFCLTTACIDEVEPHSSTLTERQVLAAPGAYDKMVGSLTSSLSGNFVYSATDQYPFDFGLPSFMVIRDVMGNDNASRASWFEYWYMAYNYGVTSAITQYPWTCYYAWVKNCNTVIDNSDVDDAAHKVGKGKAHAIRALLYSDLAQMYGMRTYLVDKSCLTVPIVTEENSLASLESNPNATNEQIWAFILEDLNKAEELLASVENASVYDPNIDLVYGLKARAYLITGEWALAEQYAKKAQENHPLMSAEEWTSHTTGFNTPTDSWIFALKYLGTDPNIVENDGDSSWGSQMCIEISATESQCGYAANYGQPHLVDRHLYESIPATDFRKDVFIDFAIDELESDSAKLAALDKYVDSPEYADWLLHTTGAKSSDWGNVGGLVLKFRTGGGDAGRRNQKIGFCVSVPVMRAEEMKLIEIEAAGRQDEARGKAMLEKFAKSRDAEWVYGNHNEAYGNSTTSPFLNEVWWQRRVELWGEGFSMLDVKRLNKGIIRSYANTNHKTGYRWNTDGPAAWMSLTIGQTETNYNSSCISNPVPVQPNGDDPEFPF